MISAAWSLLTHARTHTHANARTHTRTHRGTVCRCSARHSLRHTVHIYSFITMRHCLTKDSTFSPPHHQPQAWAAVCSEEGGQVALPTVCYSALHQSVLQHQTHCSCRKQTEEMCFFIVSVLHHILKDGLHCCLTVTFPEPLFFCKEFAFPFPWLEDLHLELADTICTQRARASVAWLSWVTLRWPCCLSRVQHHPRVETAGLDSSNPQNCVRVLDKCWYMRDGWVIFHCVAYLNYFEKLFIYEKHKVIKSTQTTMNIINTM